MLLLSLLPRQRVLPPRCSSPPPDPLGLEGIRLHLLPLSSSRPAATPADEQLLALWREQIAPFEQAVYARELDADARRKAIRSLSQGLDLVEEAVRKPMLTGPSISTADVSFFPSVCLLRMTLPVHVSGQHALGAE